MIRKAQLLTHDDKDEMRYLKAVAVGNCSHCPLTAQLYEKIRDRVSQQLGPVRAHLDNLLEDREDSVDDEDETADRNISQQERDKRQVLTTARQT